MAEDHHAKMEASLTSFIAALKVFEGQLREMVRRIERLEDCIDRFPREKS